LWRESADGETMELTKRLPRAARHQE
jgi:hypothetical protein